MPHIIDTQETLAQAVTALGAACPLMARIAGQTGTPPLRRDRAGFYGLAWIIVSQQLSTASANAIFGRLAGAFPCVKPDDILNASEEVLRAAGLSAPKIRTLRHAAAAAPDLDLDRLDTIPAQDAHDRLTSVKGIGPWTADLYLLACIGHSDVFPAGDLALQEAARLCAGLAQRPSPAALLAMAEPWRPWRAVAARLLWSYYGLARQGRATPAGD